MDNISVDAFYSSAKQDVLKTSFNIVKQSYKMSGFISSTLITQHVFAFSVLPVAKHCILSLIKQNDVFELNPRVFLSYPMLLAKYVCSTIIRFQTIKKYICIRTLDQVIVNTNT